MSRVAGGGLRSMVSTVLVVISQGQETEANQQGKDHQDCFAHRMGQALQHGTGVEYQVEHGRDHQQPTEPFVGRFDQADMYLEKKQDAGEGRKGKGPEGQGSDPCAAEKKGLAVVVFGWVRWGGFVHWMFLGQ